MAGGRELTVVCACQGCCHGHGADSVDDILAQMFGTAPAGCRSFNGMGGFPGGRYR
jgi:hypothetical protein